MKLCSPNTKICAMCFHWNGYQGGSNVKPRKGMMNVYESNLKKNKSAIRIILRRLPGILVVSGRRNLAEKSNCPPEIE